MQRGEPAHRKPDNMGLVDPEMVQHRGNVVRRPRLRIVSHGVGHVRWRISPRGIGDGAIALAEMPHLRLPGAMVAGELMHEDDRCARAGLFVMQANAVIGLSHAALITGLPVGERPLARCMARRLTNSPVSLRLRVTVNSKSQWLRKASIMHAGSDRSIPQQEDLMAKTGLKAKPAASARGRFRREVQPRRQHWFLNEKSGFPFRTPAFCSVSRGQRRLGEKEYRAPSVTQGVALRVRTQEAIQNETISSTGKATRGPAEHKFSVSHHREEDFKQGLRAYAKYRDLGVAPATGGMAQAHVIRSCRRSGRRRRRRRTITMSISR